MNTDFVAGVSDNATDSLSYMFNNPVGQKYLKERRGVPAEVVDKLPSLGYSGIANMLASIKVAKYHDLGADQVIITVATDGAALYASDEPMILRKRFGGRFDEISAAEAYSRFMLGVSTDHFMELSHKDRQRMFNLGYFTWVEQQGVELDDFKARESQAFWKALRPEVEKWDEEIKKFNADVAGESNGSPAKKARTN